MALSVLGIVKASIVPACIGYQNDLAELLRRKVALGSSWLGHLARNPLAEWNRKAVVRLVTGRMRQLEERNLVVVTVIGVDTLELVAEYHRSTLRTLEPEHLG